MKLKKRYHWLSHMINRHRFKVGAEVGAATGNTTGYLLRNCPGLKELHVVDDWRPIPESAQWSRDDMKQVFMEKFAAESRIFLLEGLSWEQAENLPNESLDFVFIDASHDKGSVIKDIEAWAPKVKQTGIIAGHDLHFEGVVDALQELGINYEATNVENCWVAWRVNLYKTTQ